ncbi:MAG: SH3 domain-containing protein [Planctomycetaceae bacterium]|jgi:hypothetical protein|nr:SH3 domain-containing protein [Planctomycetaceae bacterium]
MRLLIVIFLFYVTLPQTMLWGANPIAASIIVQKTEVRSGPDLSFYPTSILKFGDEVEIYFETNNWCAIRPPLGSFSWVSAEHVLLDSNNIGIVKTTGLASRIGSEIIDSCDTVQVTLNRGEKISVIDKMETPENIMCPLWFRILPPSGEFRWIERSAIDLNFRNKNLSTQKQTPVKTAEYLTQPSKLQEYKLVVHDEPKTETNTSTSTSTSTLSSASPNNAPPLLLPQSDSDINYRNKNNDINDNKKNPINTINTTDLTANNTTKNVVNNPTNSPAISVTKKTSNLRFDNDIDHAESAYHADSATKIASAVNMPEQRYGINKTNRANLNFQRVFDELQSETVAALTGRTDDWVFVTLIEEANRLYNSAKTDAEMEKVYHIIESLKRGRSVRQDIASKRQLKTIGNYNQNQNQYTNTNTDTEKTVPIAHLTTSPITTAGTSHAVISTDKTESELNQNKTITTLSKVENQFDINGKLGMFDPLPFKHPPFAVVDDSGVITCLLTPSTDIDLRHYVGKHVGINGIRGIYRKSGQPDSQHIFVKTISIIEKQK